MSNDIVHLALLRGSLEYLSEFCRKHQLPRGRCRCQGCPLEDACADHLDDAASLAEFCSQAIENIRESETFRRSEP